MPLKNVVYDEEFQRLDQPVAQDHEYVVLFLVYQNTVSHLKQTF